ncbi:MAG: PAS domain S-box protein [Woeseia sp.]|nr:PAS domain S-box protein [Woeseia sp.]
MSADPVQDLQVEEARLEALRRYEILDTPREPAFDDVARLASSICSTPVALITFVDENRQWFKSKVGLDVTETAREVSFCATNITSEDMLIVEDASLDPRFRDNPLVTGSPFIRFYAGAPLLTPDGHRIGALCVIDRVPRKLDENQLDGLSILAKQVVKTLELRRNLGVAESARKALAAEIDEHIKIDESRQLADSFMRSTLDSLQDNIAIINPDGDIVHANDAWLDCAKNCRPPNLISGAETGTNYLKLSERAANAGSTAAAQLADAIRTIFAAESSGTISLEYACPGDNDTCWFASQLSAFGTAAGRFAVISHRDISERVAAHKQTKDLNKSLEHRVQRRTKDLENAYANLHSSEQQLRSLFENASVGIVVGKSNGDIIRFNDAFLTFSGEPLKTSGGQNLLDLVHKADRISFAQQLQKLAEGVIPGFEMEARNRKSRHPGEAWRHFSVTAVHGPDGAVAQIFALVQDLRETKESELQRNMVFDRSVDMLVIADLSGRFLVPNRACTRILGYSSDELCEINYFDIAHEEDIDHAREILTALGKGEDVQLLDVRMRTRDGEYRDIVWNAVPWTDGDLFLGVGRDVTSIRAAERVLREQDTMMRRAEQMAQIGSWQYALENKTVRCSDGLNSIFRRDIDSEPMQLDKLIAYVVEEDREKLQSSISIVAKDFVPRQTQIRVRRPDNTVRNVQTSIDVVRNSAGEVYGIIGACLDITDINQTVERLRHSENQLRALGRRLEKIREDERANISREIHDELGQMLTALKFDLTLLSGDITDNEKLGRGANDFGAALQSMATLVDSTIMSVRNIATQLRPEGLDAFGLVPAIQWHADEFSRRTKIACEVKAPAREPKLTEDVRIALFRITQEAMTNIARHANASFIDVTVADLGEIIELTVTDDGRGVEFDELASTKSLGVMGMRERATMVGGTFEISGKRDRGTTVRVRLPIATTLAERHLAGRASA